MTDAAIMMGDYVDLKFLPGLKSARVFVDIPIEHSNAFLKMFDAPDRINPVKVVIARVALPDAEQPSGPQGPATHDDISKPRTPKSRSQMAAILCTDPSFQEWLGNYDPDQPPAFSEGKAIGILKYKLNISSRRELDTDQAKAMAWDRLETDFRMRAYAR